MRLLILLFAISCFAVFAVACEGPVNRAASARKQVTAAVESLIISREAVWYYVLRIRFRNQGKGDCRVKSYSVAWAGRSHPARTSFRIPGGGTTLRTFRLNIAPDKRLEKSPGSARVVPGRVLCAAPR